MLINCRKINHRQQGGKLSDLDSCSKENKILVSPSCLFTSRSLRPDAGVCGCSWSTVAGRGKINYWKKGSFSVGIADCEEIGNALNFVVPSPIY